MFPKMNQILPPHRILPPAEINQLVNVIRKIRSPKRRKTSPSFPSTQHVLEILYPDHLFISNKTFPDLLTPKGGNMRFDYYNEELGLAIDHSDDLEPNDGYHQLKDKLKENFCLENNITLVTIPPGSNPYQIIHDTLKKNRDRQTTEYVFSNGSKLTINTTNDRDISDLLAQITGPNVHRIKQEFYLTDGSIITLINHQPPANQESPQSLHDKLLTGKKRKITLDHKTVFVVSPKQ